MGIVLPYIQRLPNGSFRYRRRVPKELAALLGKTEIVKHLGGTEKEALRRFSGVHKEAERMLSEARRRLEASSVAATALSDSEYAEYRRLEQRLRQAGFDPAETVVEDHSARRLAADHLLDSYPLDHEGVPMVPAADAAFIRALNHGLPRHAPPPTLTDALRLYLEDKVKTDNPTDRAKRQRDERVIAQAKKALEGDRQKTAIRRADAKAVREHFLTFYDNPSTAKRYFTDLRAITAHAIKETELGIPNPFAGLPIEVPGSRRDDRRPFTDAEVEAIRSRLSAHGKADLLDIWTVLEFTECRVGEVAGLLKADVELASRPCPFLRIQPNEARRLKNASSVRDIPLLPQAVAAVRAALARAGGSPFLFPSYAHNRGADSTSAALMRHVRAVTKDPQVTNHSLRHRVADKLMLAGVLEDVKERILGHRGEDISKRYGGRLAALQVMADALAKAFPDAPPAPPKKLQRGSQGRSRSAARPSAPN